MDTDPVDLEGTGDFMDAIPIDGPASVFSVSRSITSQLNTHVDVTRYAVKLTLAGISNLFEVWQLAGTRTSVKSLLEIEEMDARWVDVLITVRSVSSRSLDLEQDHFLMLVFQPPVADDAARVAIIDFNRYTNATDPSLSIIMLHAHVVFHHFCQLNTQFVEEVEWTDPVKDLIAAINDKESGSTVSGSRLPLYFSSPADIGS